MPKQAWQGLCVRGAYEMLAWAIFKVSSFTSVSLFAVSVESITAGSGAFSSSLSRRPSNALELPFIDE